jgi:hypothetical protein
VVSGTPFPAVPHPTRLDAAQPDYEAVLQAHRDAMAAGEPGYLDPTTAKFVLTAAYLWERGVCCDQGCRHCPYLAREGPAG